MRVTLIIIAWFGLLLIALGLPLSFSSSWTWVSTGTLGSSAGYFVTLCAGAIGALLALIGGGYHQTKILMDRIHSDWSCLYFLVLRLSYGS